MGVKSKVQLAQLQLDSAAQEEFLQANPEQVQRASQVASLRQKSLHAPGKGVGVGVGVSVGGGGNVLVGVGVGVSVGVGVGVFKQVIFEVSSHPEGE